MRAEASALATHDPDHALTATGRLVRLSDYRGKNVVIWFYPKADTPG